MYFVVLGRRKNRIEDQNRKDESVVETELRTDLNFPYSD